jgi:hypothetical protein
LFGHAMARAACRPEGRLEQLHLVGRHAAASVSRVACLRLFACCSGADGHRARTPNTREQGFSQTRLNFDQFTGRTSLQSLCSFDRANEKAARRAASYGTRQSTRAAAFYRLLLLAVLAQRSDLCSHHSQFRLRHRDVDVALGVLQRFLGCGLGG